MGGLKEKIELYKAWLVTKDFMIGYTDQFVEIGKMTREVQERILNERRINMQHCYSVNGKKVTVEIGCYHPELENNTCPTGSGNCAECKHCRVEMKAVDFFGLNPKIPGVE